MNEKTIVGMLKANENLSQYYISAVYPEEFPKYPAIIVENPNNKIEHIDVEGNADKVTHQFYIYVLTTNENELYQIEENIRSMYMNMDLTIDGKEYFATLENINRGIDYENGKLLFRELIEIHISGVIEK